MRLYTYYYANRHNLHFTIIKLLELFLFYFDSDVSDIETLVNFSVGF